MDRVTEGPVLISQTGELRGKRWLLSDDEIVMGRAPDCEIVIPDRQVSRYHARMIKRLEGYFIEDLDSKNGTHLNGVPIDGPERLQDGDVIQVALALKLMFVGTEATVPLSVEEAAGMGLGRLRMDAEAHRVWVIDREVDPPLSPAQYRLLEILYTNPQRVVTRSEIVRHVWSDSEEEGVSEQAIDALIRRLRDRLSEYDPDFSYVVTVRGHGFRLDNPM
jgi:hypothetical protein